jgi:phage anti-repressor protein
MANGIVTFSADLAQQLHDSAEQFPVDFDLAWQWAGYSRRERALSKLKKHFDLDQDFAPIYCKTAQGGRPGASAKLTVDCFKEFCMMAGTEQGKNVRRYFLECERIAKTAQPPKNDNMSMLEAMARSIAVLQEHESRLVSVEVQNKLLMEQNSLLVEQVKLLKSSTEALELETEANAVELQRYKNGHGRYYSIVAWCNLHGYTLSLQECNSMGRKASAMCRIQDIVPQPVNDPRFGTVNSYPDRVLEELDWEALQ